MLIQKAIIFQPKRLPKHFEYQCDFPLSEFFFDFKIGKEAFSINAVHIKATNAKGLVFFLHGTLNHIQYHLPKATVFIQNNYDVVMMDYPTYGKSKGKLTEKLLYEVVEITYKKIVEQFHFTNIIIVGRSLGTALASNLATKIKPQNLILISPYYSMTDLFNSKMNLFSFKRLKFKFENHTYLQNVTCNSYIIHGNIDKLIPIHLSKKLIPYLKNETHFIEIPNADHFNVHEHIIYQNFIKNILT